MAINLDISYFYNYIINKKTKGFYPYSSIKQMYSNDMIQVVYGVSVDRKHIIIAKYIFGTVIVEEL